MAMIVFQTCTKCENITEHDGYKGPCTVCQYTKPYDEIVGKIVELQTQLLGSTDKVNPHLRQIIAAKREMLVWVITKEKNVWKKALAELYEYKRKVANDGRPA